MKKDIEKSPLSNELKVACEIYAHNERNETIWFAKLVKTLQHKLTKIEVERCINTLFDWGIIRGEYGETIDGKAGRTYHIDYGSEQLISEMYSQWWK